MKNIPLSKALFWQLKIEFLLNLRNLAGASQPFVFFVMITLLFPLSFTAGSQGLSHYAPGIIWISVLFATFLSLDKIFHRESSNGVMSYLLLSPYPLSLLLTAKVLAHWLMVELPLIVITPLVAYCYHLSASVCQTLVITLLLGTPALSMLGAIGVLVTQGIRNAGIILCLFMFPLCVPIIIFATGAVLQAASGGTARGLIALTAAITCLIATIGPPILAATLRCERYD